MSGRPRHLEGDEALNLIRDEGFLREWRERACADPRQTFFQEPTFCAAWYEAYAGRHEPILIADWQDGALSGLMPLATIDGKLTHAGAHQCEYQGWVGDSGFARQAVATALQRYGSRWEWQNIAPGTPTDWLEEPGGRGAVRSRFASPMLDVNDEEFIRARTKGRLRSYRNRLVRRGMRYERISDIARAQALLPRLAMWCDLRQAAAHGSMPFAHDPAKADFHARLLAHPDEIWLSVLWLEDVAVAAHVGPCVGGELAMGVQGYDPFEGKLSPGTVLIFEMAGDVAKAGGTAIDLTPGGDAWKERYASHHRDVHGLVLHRSRAGALAEEARRRAAAGARAAVKQVAGEPAAIRQRLGTSRPVPEAAIHDVEMATLPATRSGNNFTVTADPDRVQQLLIAHAARVGIESSRELSQTALRRLAQGWRPAAVAGDAGLDGLFWAAPEGSGVDLSDPSAPRLLGDGRSDVPADTLVVLANGIDGSSTGAAPAEWLAAALSVWADGRSGLQIVTDSASERLRTWLDRPGPSQHAAAS